jgi:thioesterase domain-containing protein
LRAVLRWGTRGDIGRAYWAAQRARLAYHPEPYDGPITMFRAESQPRGMHDPSLGWAELAPGGLEIIEVGGTHVSIMAGTRLAALAKAIMQALPPVEGSSR